MLGLDEYGSSDEEGETETKVTGSRRVGLQFEDHTNATKNATAGQAVRPSSATDQPSQLPLDQGKLVEGPMLGPSIPPASPQPISNGATSRPQSPYSINRSIVRELTLPPIPDLSIPPSPPGSPPASTTAKFAHFLELKAQGVHFNEKLARSSALKNPSLLQKLMSFAGISEQDQYASSLPKDVYDHTDLPPWAYKEELAKSQQEILKKKEEEKRMIQRQALEFVPASVEGAGGDGSSRGNSIAGGTATGSAAAGGLGRSAAERVMAGLDRERSRTPNVGNTNGEKRRRR